tara:strand:+ start:12887 stop:13705 length:819 start_codon:yes stop_codon:yes gene_type:complete
MSATLYFHYFEKNNEMMVDHVSSNGMSNSYVINNEERIDLSNLEPVKYIARANTDHDKVFIIKHEGKEYELDGGSAPAIMIDEPMINATLIVVETGNDEAKFSINFNALCYHCDTEIKTLDGIKRIKDIKRGEWVDTLGGFKKVSKMIRTNVLGEMQEFVKFPKDAFCKDMPYNDVYVTRYHPVGVNFKNVPAEECVGKVNGVKIENLETDAYYNIQFDTAEWMNISGMYFTSHHPNHPISPLAKEMYQNIGNFREGVFYEETVNYEKACKV